MGNPVPMSIRLFKKKFLSKTKHLCSRRLQANNESVVPFAEKPGKVPQTDSMAVHLFQSFTASIIQQNTVFTR